MKYKHYLIIAFIMLVFISCNDTQVTSPIISNNKNNVGASFSPDGLRIAYIKFFSHGRCGIDNSAKSEIFVANLYNRTIKQLTFTQANCTNPVFSSNGQYIYYGVSKNTQNDLYRMNADGSNNIKLSGTEGTNLYDISRDGSTLLLYKNNSRGGDIYKMDSDGGNLKKIITENSYIEKARFSPDCSKIILSFEEKIYDMNSDGSGIKCLMGNNELGYNPVVSPTGQKIVYTSFNQNWDIFIMDVNGKNKVNITCNPYEDYDPIFSPKGDKIIFFSDRDGNKELYLMNLDGSNVKRLTYNDGYDEYPTFSSDGSKIAYQSEHNGNWDIYLMNSDGSNKINLTAWNF